MFKKSISVILTLVIVVSVICIGFSASANEPRNTNDDEIIYRYQVISNLSAGIHISGINAICSADLGAKYSTNLSITMELQKLSSGTYTTIKTWSINKTGTGAELEESRLINILSTYRLKTTFTAGNETVVVYSNPT